MSLRPRSERHRRHQIAVGGALVVASFFTAYAAGEVGSVRASAAETGAPEPTASASPQVTSTTTAHPQTPTPTAVPETPQRAAVTTTATVPTATATATATPTATVTALATSSPTATATPSATATPCVTSAPISAGTMVWGMKTSFRKYIVGPIAHGNIAVSDGATQAASNGLFTFGGGTGTYTASSGAFTGSYKGKIVLKGHETPVGSGTYDLNMTLANPKITITGSTGVLSLDAVGSEGNALPGLKFVNLALAGKTPTVSGTTVTYTAIPTTMHDDAVVMFGTDDGGSFYGANELFDPVTFSLDTASTPSTSTPVPCVTSQATTSASPSASSSSSSSPTPSATATGTNPPGTGGLPATGANPAPLMLLASGLLAGGTVLLSFSLPVKGGRYRRE